MQKNESELIRRVQCITEDFDGIIPQHEAFYLKPILYTSGRALSSFNMFSSSIDSRNPELLISLIQEFIGYSAALSRYFWPSLNPKKKVKKPLDILKLNRGQKLVDAYKIDDTSPLKDRNLRNAWEHFDERLDLFLVELNAAVVYPDCMIGKHDLADCKPNHIFKLIDLEADIIILMNEKYHYKGLKDEVEYIYKKTLEFLDNGERLH